MIVTRWLSVLFLWALKCQADASSHLLQSKERAISPVVEERARMSKPLKFDSQTISNLKTFNREQGVKKGIPDTIGRSGMAMAGIAKTKKEERPLKEVILDITDQIIPVITTALAMAGPVGMVIGAVLGFAYGIISTILRGPQKNPMEDIIRDISKSLQYLDKKIDQTATYLDRKATEERNEQFKKVLNDAVQSEIGRNDYVCEKCYNLFRQYYIDLEKNRTVCESFRILLLAQIHDCDNVLKDTSQAFLYLDFADIFWYPSMVARLSRVLFLTQVTKYAESLKIDANTTILFWNEIATELVNQFQFSGIAVRERVHTIRRISFNNYEDEACKLQQRFLYFDQVMYPYGVPSQFVIFNEDTVLKVSDFTTIQTTNKTTNTTTNTTTTQPIHIQVFYNNHLKTEANPSIYLEGEKQASERFKTIFNCLMGPAIVTRVPEYEMWLWVQYVPQRSYQIRVVYFAEKYWSRFGKYEGTTKNSIIVYKEVNRTLLLSVTDEAPKENETYRYEYETGIHVLWGCADPRCSSRGDSQIGTLIVETVTGFNVLSQHESNGLLVFRNHYSRVLLLGIELIVRSPMPFFDTL